MPVDLKKTLLDALPKELVLDLYDVVHAKALAAHELVKDTGLDAKRQRGLEGQARFRFFEKSFEDICERHGGVPLENELIPGTSQRVYQPFRRFQGANGVGIILGLAMIPVPGELPTRNFSRDAGVTLNYSLTPRLDFDGTGPKPGDLFALLLAARDRRKPGYVEQVAMGFIDSKYEGFPFFESVETFLAGYASAPETTEYEVSAPLVTLKKRPAQFQPPEDTPDSREEGDRPA